MHIYYRNYKQSNKSLYYVQSNTARSSWTKQWSLARIQVHSLKVESPIMEDKRGSAELSILATNVSSVEVKYQVLESQQAR